MAALPTWTRAPHERVRLLLAVRLWWAAATGVAIACWAEGKAVPAWRIVTQRGVGTTAASNLHINI